MNIPLISGSHQRVRFLTILLVTLQIERSALLYQFFTNIMLSENIYVENI